MTISEQWCVFCKREPLAHTPEEYDRCMKAAGKQATAEDNARLRHEVATLRAALGEVVWAADEMLAGGEIAIAHAEQCTECGLGGEGPLKDALRKVGTLVRRRGAPMPTGGGDKP